MKLRSQRRKSLVHLILSASIVYAALSGGSILARGQALSSVSGTVTDSSGAVVPGARVTVRSANTGLERYALTGTSGQYRMASLPSGDYRLVVVKHGFAPVTRLGIHIAVGEDAEIEVRLRPTGAEERVVVHAGASPVSVTTEDVSGLVNDQQIKDLPLNGRSFDELMALDPGVVNFTSQKVGGVGVSNSTVGNNFSVSGNRPQQNLYLLNGIEFTGAAENNMQPGGVSQELLGVDAVREFNLLRDDYGAAYGKRPGAQVLIVTQSGTNEFHGSVYEFLRNSAFDARNYFNRASVPPFQRNQFGVSAGGPLQRDHTFVFGNYEGFRQHLHQAGVALVPDANARAGYLPCKLASVAPDQCPSSGLVNVGVNRAVKPLLALWPAPDPGSPDFGGIAEVFNSPLQTIRDDFGTVRLDRNFGHADLLTGAYTIDDSADVTPTSANLYSTDLETLREQVLSLEETHVFSPALLNVARVGYSRAAYFYTGEPTPGTPAAAVGGFVAGKPVGAVVVGGSAAANPSAQVSLAGSNIGSNLHIARNLYTYEDSLTLTRGANTLSAGAWLQPVQSNEDLALTQYGQASFTGLLQFLQGNVGTFLYDPAPTEMNWRTLLGAWYVQDAVRLRPDLTLSLGFRDEFTTGWNEAHGRASSFVFAGNALQTAPHIGRSAFTVNNARFLPQPRIGLAWNPRGTTALRAGFGMYNDLQDALGYRMDQNAPFNPSYAIANLPVASLPLPASPVPANAKVAPGGVQPDMKTPTLVSWSIRVEQQLTPSTAFTLGYVGSHGYHEILSLDDNEAPPSMCPSAQCPVTYPANFPAPLAGSPVPAGSYYIPKGTPFANPALGAAWAWFSLGTSAYHSLEADLRRTMSRGLMLRATYTWSKALDDGDSLNGTAAGNAPGLVSNPYDLRADWGPATYDVRNVGVFSQIYQLPFGRNRRFADRRGVADALIGGWTANSIVTIQSGFPFTPQLSYNPSNNGDNKNPVRPFLNPNFHGKVVVGKPDEWFDPAAFLAPPEASGFYGDVGRDSFTGPGLAEWDLSLFKDTALHERTRLQLRAEFFNLLNRANFNTPNLVVFTPAGVSPTAGVITSTSTTSRQVQFAAKILW